MRNRVATLFAGRLAGAASTLGFTIAVSQRYGPDGRGRVAVALLIGVIAGAVLSLGLDAAATYSVASGRGRAATWRSFAVRYAVGVGLATTALLALLSGPLASLFGVERVDVLCGAAAVPALIGANLLLGIVLGEERTTAYASLAALQSVVPGAVVIALAGLGVNLGFLLAGWVAAVWVTTAVIWRVAGGRGDGGRLQLGSELGYGSRTVLGTLLQLTNYRLDTLLLAGFAGAAAAGIYTVAVNVAEVLGYLPSAVETALFPALARRGGDAAAELRRPLLAVGLLTAAGAGVLVLVAPSLLPALFGPAFSASVRPLRLLLPGMIAIAVTKVLSASLMGSGRPFRTTIVAGAAAVCTVVLDLALIPRHGASGAAIASSLAYALSAVLAAQMVFGGRRGERSPTRD